MTNTVYPPDHLLRKWEELIIDEEENVDVVLYEAFQAGADQELEACCEWLAQETPEPYINDLRFARRPQPPSLKEQALKVLKKLSKDSYPCAYQDDADWDTIYRALESLPD